MTQKARIAIALVPYAAALLVFGLPGLSGATTINVATEAEYRNALTTLSGDNSGPHTINVTADIMLDDGTPDPTYSGAQPLTVIGNGFTLDAAGTSRVLFVTSAAALTVNGVTMANGNTSGGGGAGIRADGSAQVINSTFMDNDAAPSAPGGAVRTIGSLTVQGSTFTGNTAGSGGAGGAMYSFASATVTNSTISGNSADGTAGGIRADASVTVTNSTISGNTGGPTGGGGGISAGGAVTVTNSTVSGNSVGGGGGGILAGGSVTVTNSTISGNTAGVAGNGGGISAFDSTTLTHATVVENSAPNGANLFVSRGGLTSFGSVLALPQGGGTNCLVTGGTTSTGYNHDTNGSCGFGGGPGDTSGGPDPELGPLTNNGGTTETRLPQTGSALIDAIPEDDCHEGVTEDQRTVTRPQDGDEDGTLACDIGAVEVVPGENQPGPGPARPVEGAPSFTG